MPHLAVCVVIFTIALGCQGTAAPKAQTAHSAINPQTHTAESKRVESWFEIGGFEGEDSTGKIQDLGYCWLRTTETIHEGEKALLLQDESRTVGFSAEDTGFRSGTVETVCRNDGSFTPIRVRSTTDSYSYNTYEIGNGRIKVSRRWYSGATYDKSKREWVPDSDKESAEESWLDLPGDGSLIDVSGVYRLVCHLPRKIGEERRLQVLTPDGSSSIVHRAQLTGQDWEEVRIMGKPTRAFRFRLDREGSYDMDFWVSEEGAVVKVRLDAEVNLTWRLTDAHRGLHLHETMHPRQRGERMLQRDPRK